LAGQVTEYQRLDKPLLAAFFFTGREKDYGGIHLGVPASSIGSLVALTEELSRLPGHSRKLPLYPVPNQLPLQIVDRRCQSLVSLRIGSAVDSITCIEVKSGAGNIVLSPDGLAEFKKAITLVHSAHGDLVLAGKSGSWTDRLWFWPLEN
jgi:hypothetical protein